MKKEAAEEEDVDLGGGLFGDDFYWESNSNCISYLILFWIGNICKFKDKTFLFFFFIYQ